MSDDIPYHSSNFVNRRWFVGGITSLFAAASYSLHVPSAVAAQVTAGDDSATQMVTSPDGSVEVTIDVTDGTPTYAVAYDDTTAVRQSAVGFEFQNQADFGVGESAVDVTGSERSTTDTTWTPVWDQYDEIREHYAELRIGLEERADSGRSGTLEVRVFDDGFGFRFVFGDDFDEFVVTSERTAYNFAGDYTSWWIPNDYNNFEVEYEETSLSAIESELEDADFADGGDGVHTPMTVRTDDDVYLSVHEADLTDYASLALTPRTSADDDLAFESTLAPLPDGTKVSAAAPHVTPWRTFQLGTRPGELVESSLLVNLNEDYDDDVFAQGVDWIEPQKFVGIWWLMITDRADWEYRGPETGNHAAQTERAKQYMDFASEHSIPGVLVEGWNEGWDTFPGDGSGFDFTESYPDFDLEAVTSYGSSLEPPTQMTMHNETAGDFLNYESQLDEAFGLYDDLGIRTIKNGYVADDGDLAGEGHNHHNQVLVNHHTLVAEAAAANRQMLDVHEPIHPTGRRRTYPNLMTREGVKGQEYDSFGYVSPEHHVTFPFTRMLGGPVEYTPGIFDMDSGSGGIETTRAKQLAMYPTYFSGLQMVADLPSSYLADQPATLEVGEVAQAEFADRDGFETAARWSHAQGERYVPVDPNGVEAGSTITWTVTDVEAAGEYDLHLRYASDEEENAVPADEPRTATVTVDGSAVAQVEVPPTDYWDVWDSIATTVALDEGDSTVGLRFAADDTGGFNLDSIAVTEPGEPMPEPEHDPIRGPTLPAFQFIEDVPAAGWDDTRVLDSAIGDYMVTARQKDEEWYVGAMTDENPRGLEISLEFIASAPGERTGRGRRCPDDATDNEVEGHSRGKYVAEIYADGADARYDENLTDVRIDELLVDSRTTVFASMAGSGGQAIRLRPASAADRKRLSKYEAPEQEYSSFDAPDVAVSSQPIDLTVSGTNSGSVVGGEELNVYVDGERAGTVFVRLSPGESESTARVDLPSLSPGDHEIRVGRSLDDALPAQTTQILEEIDLAGTWLFREGDDAAWAEPDVDDGDWDAVELPANWEDHSDYTDDLVYGWYRKTITVPEKWEEYGEGIRLPLGKIDDVDETFFNGTKIGQMGSFPDDFSTAWSQAREYTVSGEDVDYGGENVIAIRVYDEYGGGGLYEGPLGPVQLESDQS